MLVIITIAGGGRITGFEISKSSDYAEISKTLCRKAADFWAILV